MNGTRCRWRFPSRLLPGHQFREFGVNRRDVLEIALRFDVFQLGDVIGAKLVGLAERLPAPVGVVVHERGEGPGLEPPGPDGGMGDLQDRPGRHHDVGAADRRFGSADDIHGQPGSGFRLFFK